MSILVFVIIIIINIKTLRKHPAVLIIFGFCFE